MTYQAPQRRIVGCKPALTIRAAGLATMVLAILAARSCYLSLGHHAGGQSVLRPGQCPSAPMTEEDRVLLLQDHPLARKLCNMAPCDRWKLLASIPLGFNAHHPQGLLRIDNRRPGAPSVIGSGEFLMTTVDPHEKMGYLIRFVSEKEHIRLVSQTAISFGEQYHPGGMDYDPRNGRVWFAVSEYHPGGTSTIVEVNPFSEPLEIREAFHLDDHIGTMMCDTGGESLHLYMIDWTTAIYCVSVRGEEAVSQGVRLSGRYKFKPDGTSEYQDCKNLEEHFFLCAGKEGGLLGASKPGRLAICYANVERSVRRRDPNEIGDYDTVPFEIVKEFEAPFISPEGRLERSYRIGSVPFTYNATDFTLAENEAGEDVLLLYGVPQDRWNAHLVVLEIPLSSPPLGALQRE